MVMVEIIMVDPRHRIQGLEAERILKDTLKKSAICYKATDHQKGSTQINDLNMK